MQGFEMSETTWVCSGNESRKSKRDLTRATIEGKRVGGAGRGSRVAGRERGPVGNWEKARRATEPTKDCVNIDFDFVTSSKSLFLLSSYFDFDVD